jgi:uncharacterized protein
MFNIFRKFNESVEINFHKIKIKDLNSSFKRLRIVQISDLHTQKNNLNFLANTLNQINSLKPDILAITGDLICNGRAFINDIKNMLDKIEVKHEKIACLGNHDYSDNDGSLSIKNMFKKANVRLLNNSSYVFIKNGEKLYFSGCEDVDLGDINLENSIKSVPKNSNLIYLAHNPVIFDEITKLKECFFLAGHTHGMQLNFEFLKKYYKKRFNTNYISGIYKNKDSTLYVNKGLGTALCTPKILGIKLLINTPRVGLYPEISVFDLE